MKRPRSNSESANGSLVTVPRSANMIALLGGIRRGAVSVSPDEYRALGRLYEFREPAEDENVLTRAGSTRNVFRHAEADGLRAIAYLARFLEPEEDPVAFLVRVLSDGGYDISGDDIGWAEAALDGQGTDPEIEEPV